MFEGTVAMRLGPASRSAGRTPVVPSGVLAMLVLVATEIMLFAGLVSAYLIGRAGAVGWPPPGQPRVPVEVTAFNTVLLLASAVALVLADRRLVRGTGRPAARRWLAAAMALGTAFVALQGYEWTRLVWFGLTLRSSTYGSFFYLVVGAHALHAVAALLGLAWAAGRLRAGTLDLDTFRAVQVFWYFVVAVWPILYVVVYLL